MNQRLKSFLKEKKISLTSLANEGYATRVTIGKYVNNDMSIPSEFLQRLKSAHPDLNLNWLFTGEGHMLLSEQNKALEKDLTDILQHVETVEKFLNKKFGEEWRED